MNPVDRSTLCDRVAACTGDIVVMLDTDGTTEAAEIPCFVAALPNGADIAKGSRFVLGGRISDITPFRRVGNRVLNACSDARSTASSSTSGCR